MKSSTHSVTNNRHSSHQKIIFYTFLMYSVTPTYGCESHEANRSSGGSFGSSKGKFLLFNVAYSEGSHPFIFVSYTKHFTDILYSVPKDLIWTGAVYSRLQSNSRDILYINYSGLWCYVLKLSTFNVGVDWCIWHDELSMNRRFASRAHQNVYVGRQRVVGILYVHRAVGILYVQEFRSIHQVVIKFNPWLPLDR